MLMSAKRWKKMPIDWKNPQQLTRLIDRTVWSCLFIAGAYLTGQMFVELVQQYTATTTDASVKINETITFPPAVLCRVIIIDSEKISDDQLYIDVMEYFNRTDISKEEFLYNLSWPSYIIDAVTNYLAVIRSRETNIYEPSREEGKVYQPNIPLWEATHAFLLRHNITSIELQYKYGEEVRESGKLTVQFKSSRTSDEYTEIYPRSSSLEQTPLPVRPVQDNRWNDGAFSKLSICWQFPFNEYEFHADASNVIQVIAESQYLFLTFEKGNLYKYIPDVVYDSKKTFVFSYDAILDSLPVVNGVPQCQTEEPAPTVCTSNCRASGFRKNCSILEQAHSDFIAGNGSSPSHSSFNSTYTDYATCLNLINFAELEENCRKSCLPFCSFFSLTLDKSFEDNGYTDFAFRLSIRSFVYAEVNERFLYTFADFVAAAGGVLGFWLGLDAIFFISLLFIPTMWLIEYYLKARNNPQPEGNENSSSNLISECKYIIRLVNLLKIDATGLKHAFLIKKILEKFFWFLIYLLGSILTIIMCVQFYLNFRATPISSPISVAFDNQIILPSATVCLPLHQIEMGVPSNMPDIRVAYDALTDIHILGHLDWEVNKTALTIFKYGYQDINSMSMTKDSLLYTNERWPIELMRVARQYLILLGSFATMEIEDLRSTWQAEHFVKEHYNRATIDLLATKLDQLSVDYNELLQKFALELQRYQLINITKHKRINQSSVDYSLKVGKAAFITDKIVCYWLPAEATSFTSTEEYINIYLNKTLLPGWQDIPMELKKYIPVPQKISLRVPGRSTDLMIANQRELSLEAEMGDKLTTALNVDRHFILRQDIENCTTKRVLDECYAKCRISDTEVQCNCTWPAEGLDEGKKTL